MGWTTPPLVKKNKKMQDIYLLSIYICLDLIIVISSLAYTLQQNCFLHVFPIWTIMSAGINTLVHYSMYEFSPRLRENWAVYLYLYTASYQFFTLSKVAFPFPFSFILFLCGLIQCCTAKPLPSCLNLTISGKWLLYFCI